MARLDRTGKRSRWQVARASEVSYNAKLRQVARQIGNIVAGLAPDGEVDQVQERDIRYSLQRYADILAPWARSVARFMVADVNRHNERAWHSLSREISSALWTEIKQAPTGMLFEALMQEQVTLIQSMPLKAAERVHKLVTEEGLVGGRRSSSMAKDILATGHVTESRATLIARTETSRATQLLTKARATYAGSEGYIWRTSKDGNVRDTHKAQEGKYVRWGHPPKTDPGLDPYDAGCGPNCRCWCEPIIPYFD